MTLSPGIELPNKDKKRQKPNILHYRRGRVPFSNRDIQLIFEKDNSTAEDYKFYGMQ
ncbi:MAG: hypothetical protein U5L96_08115 [Owenweeksia sp.]|nr:hypothetical protein [Owenweeksia sp.]